jgi:plastocyanin
MNVIKLGLATIVAGLALAAPALAATQENALTGIVGPAFTITMNKHGGKPSTNMMVKAGTYVITIDDKSSIHNFHLTGPGVNMLTSVPTTGTTRWNVKLKKGTYHFVCDAHPTIMHGILKVS